MFRPVQDLSVWERSSASSSNKESIHEKLSNTLVRTGKVESRFERAKILQSFFVAEKQRIHHNARSGALDASRKMLFAAQEEQARVKRTSDQLCGAFQGMGIK